MMEIRKPIWGKIWLHILLWFMYIMIALLASCGTRKVNETTDKYKESSSSKQEQVGSREITSNVSINSSISQNNDKIDESQSRKVTELFNENGSLKSRITELLNTKSVDKSIIVTNTVTKLKTRYIEKWKILQITKNNKEIIYRTRTIDRNSSLAANIGGYLGVIGLLVIIGALLAFKFLKKT
jgi:hypothetical protein